ncbi:MAG TPA: FG-GAP-like repeat-containing protein [Verrucomicrobiae bacterium]|nr:FG-GAP-like repeat-containing protein [Verrucomicrobiae bacterium]
MPRTHPIIKKGLGSRFLARVACLMLLACCFPACKRSPSVPTNQTGAAADPRFEQFLSLMNAGKNYLDQGDATNALVLYKRAQAVIPNDIDVRLNMANSYLLAGAADEAIREADEALKLEPNSAAAYFVKGSAYLRLSNGEEAAKAMENVKRIDPGEPMASFQLGRARMEVKQWDAAITAFQEGIKMDPNRLHTTVHYLLAQALLRAGRQAEAERELQQHQISREEGGPAVSPATFERSKYTQARVPFRLEQPDPAGIKVRFVDATQTAFGDRAGDYSGPVGVIDPHHTGNNSLFVMEKGNGFRLLWNTNSTFQPAEKLHPAIAGVTYAKMLVGDLQNDRFEDVIVLGDKASHLFKFETNGVATDAASQSQLQGLGATDGLLMDLDFTGKLDLVAVSRSNDVQVYRQFGPLLFTNITARSGIPSSLQNAQSILMQDWNRDQNTDVLISRKTGPPLLFEKQRGGRLLPGEPTNWVAGAVFSAGDFDNDLRPDLAVVANQKIIICFQGGAQKEIAVPEIGLRQLVAVDYDNDGWLDLWAVGEKLRAWRNVGLAGFQEQTVQLGLDRFTGGAVSEVHFADFDLDCDSDVIVGSMNGGLHYLRNDGANENGQVKVHLFGTRSNASGIGCKVEIETGGLRLIRTIDRLPVEVGVGKHQRLDSFLVHWFNWPQGSAEVPFSCKEPLFALELTIQEGSCPYLYAWDGNRFRFVTDILGAAPLGLPLAEGRYIDADPEEIVWIGDEHTFPAREGIYQLRITEELREVLYLDEAKLIVVDRDPATEVHSTDKLLPAKPFPRGELMTLHREFPLLNAEVADGTDVSTALKAVDGRRVSPGKLRVPQLRGLAEAHGVTLDFGPLDETRALVLVMNGWLRFGGGMANIAASHDPSLPFPFPSLEVEVASGIWKAVDVTVGAPAGKTKTILVDLEGRLPAGARRLRLSSAFEIHWDRIALMEKQSNARTAITFVPPSVADLHFRGFSPAQNLPPDCPLTPDYGRVSANSYWTLTPGGWCTRYGDILELVANRDEGLALLNSGDELSLEFPASALPPKPAGTVREFFLYVDGWDKDSDFHVVTGTQVEPLPFHGMNDQLYGREQRPRFSSDALHRKYNTRWVEGRTLKQVVRR